MIVARCAFHKNIQAGNTSEFPVKLRRGFGGVDVDVGGVDFEVDEPFAGYGAAVSLGGRKFPALRGLQGAVGEKLTGAAGVDGGLGYGARFVDTYFDRDADGAANGVAGRLRGVGQNLLENFSMDNARGAAGCRGCCGGRRRRSWRDDARRAGYGWLRRRRLLNG